MEPGGIPGVTNGITKKQSPVKTNRIVGAVILIECVWVRMPLKEDVFIEFSHVWAPDKCPYKKANFLR